MKSFLEKNYKIAGLTGSVMALVAYIVFMATLILDARINMHTVADKINNSRINRVYLRYASLL